MSFDKLRKELPGRNFWILVLDTKGINVWCSAGKGTFGTIELVGRIESSGLSQIVSHRELILPQLAGPGVAAHEVKKLSGFKVIYGPIRSKDLPTFLDNGRKATPEMRIKNFSTLERMALIPMELGQRHESRARHYGDSLLSGFHLEIGRRVGSCLEPRSLLSAGFLYCHRDGRDLVTSAAAVAARASLFTQGFGSGLDCCLSPGSLSLQRI